MSELHLECSTCKAIRPESEARNIPTFRAETTDFVDGYYCVDHAPASLASVQQQIAGLDFDADERDDMTPLLMLLTLLCARGHISEDLRDDEPHGEGMEHTRQQVLALLRRIERGDHLPIEVEFTALCSACYRVLPASQIRVLPWYNDSVGNYVTTFRCGECFARSIAETRAHLEAGGDREVVQMCEFFGRHAVTIDEYHRGDQLAAVRLFLLDMLDILAEGTIALPIGETVPLSEVLGQTTPASQAPPPPAPAPAPEPAPRRSWWSRLFGREPD